MGDNTKEFKQKLATITAAYRANLPEKAKLLDAFRLKIQNSTLDDDEHEEMYRLVHGLAGSAETFGLKDLTDAARQVVNTLKASTPEEKTPERLTSQLQKVSELIYSIKD